MTTVPTTDGTAAATDRTTDAPWRGLRDAIRTMLDDHGYSVESRCDGQDLRFHAVTEDERRWRMQILIDERHPVARLYVYLDLEYAQPMRDWVLELACRVNSLLAIGAFDFDWETGQIAFRHGRDFTGQTIDAAHAAQLLKVAVVALRLFTRAYDYHTVSGVSPAGALDAARGAEDLADDGVSTEAGRRVLVRLVK
jgi:hypothetical protein